MRKYSQLHRILILEISTLSSWLSLLLITECFHAIFWSFKESYLLLYAIKEVEKKIRGLMVSLSFPPRVWGSFFQKKALQWGINFFGLIFGRPGRTGSRKELFLVLCHSCYIYGSQEAGEGLNSNEGGHKWGTNFYGGS